MSEIKVNSIKGVGATNAAITVNNSDGTCTANITNNLSNRNLIINGAMQVAQRGTSFTDPTGVPYTLDRFAMQNSSGTPAFNVTQDSDAPHGFNKSLKVACTTADASPAAGSISRVFQYIEAQNMQGLAKGTSSAKPCTLSFYVKTNKTGLYTVFVFDADNTRLMSGSYTVSNTDWNRYTILIPADTTGVLDNGNGQGFGIFWGLSLGSDRTSGSLQSSFGSYAISNEHAGNVNFADNTSNVWAITGVQLEVGSVATDFEHRSFGQELALCQRYFYSAMNANGVGEYMGWGIYLGSAKMMSVWYMPQPMRANPTVSFPTGTNYYDIYRADGSDQFDSLGSILGPSKFAGNYFVNIEISSNVSSTGGYSGTISANNSAVYIHFSAEL